MPRSPAAARRNRSSISGRRRAARASSGWRAIEREPPRTPHKMADGLRKRCRWLQSLQRTRSTQTSSRPAAASAGAASQRHATNSRRPATCRGGRPLSLSPQKTCLLGGTFRSPGRTEKRKVVPPLSSFLSFASLFILSVRQALCAPHTAACNPAGVEEAVARLGAARLLGIRFVAPERLVRSFVSSPLPLFRLYLAMRRSNPSRLESQTAALQKTDEADAIRAGWSAGPGSASGGAHREDGSLGKDAWFASLPPVPLCPPLGRRGL